MTLLLFALLTPLASALGIWLGHAISNLIERVL